jgi:hypothetical protein
MARTYGAVYLDIWRDKDFRALTHTEQYLYWALIFQLQLNGVGLLDYIPSRWAEATSDMTTADVEVTIKSLIAKRYVVHDPTTHELLVRTYVRNSKVWKMPKAFAGVIPAAAQIQSSKLRRALLADLDKIPLGELSEAPATNGGPSVRAKIDAYLEKLRAVLDDGEPDDPAGLDESDLELQQGHEADAERVSVPNAYGSDTGSANPGTSTRACAQPVPLQVHVPVQVPTPLAPLASVTVLPVAAPEPPHPVPAIEPVALFECAPVARGDESKEVEPVQNSQTLIGEWVDYRIRGGIENKPTSQMIGRVGKELKKLLVEVAYEVVRQGFMEWDAKGAAPTAIPSFVDQVQSRRAAAAVAGSNIVELHPGGFLPGQRISPTDRAIADAAAAGERAKLLIYGSTS